MNSLFGILGTIAGFIQFGITFFVLLELKGLIFTLGSIFIFPVFATFPIWGYFYGGILIRYCLAFLTLVVGGMVEASSP